MTPRKMVVIHDIDEIVSNLSYLDCFVLQPQSVEGADGLLGIVLSVIVDESIAKALTCNYGIN